MSVPWTNLLVVLSFCARNYREIVCLAALVVFVMLVVLVNLGLIASSASPEYIVDSTWLVPAIVKPSPCP